MFALIFALRTQLLTTSFRQRQLSKFAFVQDRLREWRPDVLTKIEHFSCMTLAMLDIDGYRIDKGLTITIDAQAEWSNSIRACAKRFGKENFYISGTYISRRDCTEECPRPKFRTRENHNVLSTSRIRSTVCSIRYTNMTT